MQADYTQLRTILSASYIQSKPWVFATADDRQRFEAALAALPPVQEAVEDWEAVPISRRAAKSIGLPAGNGLGRALRIRSGYQSAHTIVGDYRSVVLAHVLAMSSPEHRIMTLRDTEAGARIISDLPMSMWTWPGTITLTIHAENEQFVTVEANAVVSGQIFDWFRCRRTVENILRDAQMYLVAMGATPV